MRRPAVGSLLWAGFVVEMFGLAYNGSGHMQILPGSNKRGILYKVQFIGDDRAQYARDEDVIDWRQAEGHPAA